MLKSPRNAMEPLQSKSLLGLCIGIILFRFWGAVRWNNPFFKGVMWREHGKCATVVDQKHQSQVIELKKHVWSFRYVLSFNLSCLICLHNWSLKGTVTIFITEEVGPIHGEGTVFDGACFAIISFGKSNQDPSSVPEHLQSHKCP